MAEPDAGEPDAGESAPPGDAQRRSKPIPDAAPRIAPHQLLGGLVLVALALAAFNLRTAVTSVGPLLAEIRAGLGMGAVTAGLLTALPPICFVVFGSVAPKLVARVFPSRLVWLALAALTIGLVARPLMPGSAAFVLVSCLALGAIGVANVMMPVVVRRAFPHDIGRMTGLYAMSMALGAAIAAAGTVPLTELLGGDWRLGLAIWAVPAGLATLLWMRVALQVRRSAEGRPTTAGQSGLRIARSRTAWAVAVLFGLQSIQGYVTMGWLPQIYRDAGLSAAYAGVLLAVIPAVGVPVSYLVPTIAARMRGQGATAVGLTALGFVGYLGLWTVPAVAPWLWVTFLGISQGVFPLSLTLIGLRTRTAAGTVGLSSFGQSVGYLISIPGPIVVGAIYGATGGWHLVLALLMLLLVPQGVVGVLAGRRRFVEDDLGLD